jgi:hypothetical protein
MTPAHRHLALIIPATLALALVVAACGSGTASTAPSSVASASPAPSALASTAPASTAPASTAPASTAPPSAATSPSSAIACTTLPATGTLASDRLTDVKVASDSTSDRLTFVFGDAALSNPGGPAKGSLDIAKPPYTQAGSGAPIAVTGDHVLQLTFTGMSLQNDAGEEMFTGPTEVKPKLAALRHAVQFDASEGVIGWYIGYAGNGCVALGHDGKDITITIDHS